MTESHCAVIVYAILDRAHALDGANLDAVARAFGQENFTTMLREAEFFEEDTGGGFTGIRAELQDTGVEVLITDSEAGLPESEKRFAVVFSTDVNGEEYAITVEGDQVTWRGGRLVDEGQVGSPTTPAQ